MIWASTVRAIRHAYQDQLHVAIGTLDSQGVTDMKRVNQWVMIAVALSAVASYADTRGVKVDRKAPDGEITSFELRCTTVCVYQKSSSKQGDNTFAISTAKAYELIAAFFKQLPKQDVKKEAPPVATTERRPSLAGMGVLHAPKRMYSVSYQAEQPGEKAAGELTLTSMRLPSLNRDKTLEAIWRLERQLELEAR